MISEKQREEIRKEAKGILDNFANALKKVKINDKKERKEVGGFRKEGKGEECDEEFRRQMFKNAPQHDEDCIIAERKKW